MDSDDVMNVRPRAVPYLNFLNDQGASTSRPQHSRGMSGQLGQVTLDAAVGEALAGLLGEV